MKSSWHNHYREYPAGEAYKRIQPVLNRKPWFCNENSRPFIRILSRIRSSHCLHPQHKYKIGLKENPLCRCGKLGDLEHCILECPLKLLEISKMYKGFLDSQVILPVNLQYLLSLGDISIYKIIYKFVSSSNTEI